MTKKHIPIIALSSIIFFTSCEKTPVVPNEEEIITTLSYTLTPAGGGSPIVLTYKDLDGDGGNAPVITGGTLNDSTTYSGVLELLNETKSPADTITNEIRAEAIHHQFFFQTTINGLNINYNDTDSDGKPLGLASTLTTLSAGTGTLTITLRHEPNKSAAGVAAGNIANAGGETDLEISFNVTIQ